MEYLFALNKDEDTVSIVCLKSKATIKKVETDFNPHEIIVSKDGKKTYITCSQGNKLNIMNNQTFEIEKRMEHPDFQFPHGLGLSSNGNKLYMASTFSEKVFIFDTETDEITKILTTDQKHSHMVAVSPDGKNLYIPNIGSHTITVIDAEMEEISAHFPVGRGRKG
jgi:YVTN family beta-propeller protein